MAGTFVWVRVAGWGSTFQKTSEIRNYHEKSEKLMIHLTSGNERSLLREAQLIFTRNYFLMYFFVYFFDSFFFINFNTENYHFNNYRKGKLIEIYSNTCWIVFQMLKLFNCFNYVLQITQIFI